MTATLIDMTQWPRRENFHFFRGYAKPHYAVTSRLDVTHLVTARKGRGQSTYRACIHAIGAGIHGVPALRQRFRGDIVTAYDQIDLSMTVPMDDGTFRYAYVPWSQDHAFFDRTCAGLIAAARTDRALNANSGQRDDLAYLSCMPWLDYSSINNALPGPDDCIPRVTWGRYVQDMPGQWRMAMTIEVHHALVDGLHVGQYFAAVQDTLNAA